MLCLLCCLMQVAGASGFDLQQQMPQLQPVLKLWDQLTASLSPALRQLVTNLASSSSSSTAVGLQQSASASAAAAGDSSPVAAFIALEFEFGVSLLKRIAQTLAGLQAALGGEAHLLTAAVQVRPLLPLHGHRLASQVQPWPWLQLSCSRLCWPLAAQRLKLAYVCKARPSHHLLHPEAVGGHDNHLFVLANMLSVWSCASAGSSICPGARTSAAQLGCVVGGTCIAAGLHAQCCTQVGCQ